MPILRHQSLLLDHAEPTDQPIDGPMFQVAPNDADATFDGQQHFGLFVALTREGDGVARVELLTSPDKVTWHRVAQLSTPQDELAVVDFVEIGAFFPYVRVRTTVAPATTAGPAPKHSVLVRLASDAPFTLEPV